MLNEIKLCYVLFLKRGNEIKGRKKYFFNYNNWRGEREYLCIFTSSVNVWYKHCKISFSQHHNQEIHAAK